MPRPEQMSRDKDTSSSSKRKRFFSNGGKNQTILDTDCIRLSSRGCWEEELCQQSQGGVSQEAGSFTLETNGTENTDTPWRSFKMQTGRGRKWQCGARSSLERGYFQSFQTFVKIVHLYSYREEGEYSKSPPNRSSTWNLPHMAFLGLFNVLKTEIGFLRHLCTGEFKSSRYNVAANEHFLKEVAFIYATAM